MTTTRYKILLRTLLGAILSSRMSESELYYLVGELRKGQITDELAFLLEQISGHIRDDLTSSNNLTITKHVENLIKSKRVSKDSVINIIESIDTNNQYDLSRNFTMRDILERFVESASPRRVDQFIEIIESSGTSDAYLKGISEKRK